MYTAGMPEIITHNGSTSLVPLCLVGQQPVMFPVELMVWRGRPVAENSTMVPIQPWALPQSTGPQGMNKPHVGTAMPWQKGAYLSATYATSGHREVPIQTNTRDPH